MTQGITACSACAHLHGLRGTKRWCQLRQGSELAALYGAQGGFVPSTVAASPARRAHDAAPGTAGTKQVLGSPGLQDRLTLTL